MNKKYSIVKRVVTILLLLGVTVFALTPLGGYYYTLSLLNTYPEQVAGVKIEGDQLQAQWQANEPNLSISGLDEVTPYWIYRWLVVAILNDYFSVKDLDPYGNVSLMASKIAIHHMRVADVKGNLKGMLLWHLLNVNLGIWIQRHWTAEEILVKYNEIYS
jgi:hypothetical protein